MIEPVIVVDYDPGWPAMFRRLGDRAMAALGDVALGVEHVGSTAVPDLAAKPIIDLDVVVRSNADIPAAGACLAPLGYVHEGDRGIPGREAFLWPPGEPRHHLYVLPADSPELRRHLAFRDYLRAHLDVARTYGDLKRSAARRHRDDRVAYMAAKDALIKEILERAIGCRGNGELGTAGRQP
jgi:GrpB-like predicted nucleotidyltransferase (UPF0157 family)